MEGWRFDVDGIKFFYPMSALATLGNKLRAIRKAVGREEARTGDCRRCGHPTNEAQRARFAALDAEEAAEEAEAEADGRVPW